MFAVEKSAESSTLSRRAVTISVPSSALSSTECGLISNAVSRSRALQQEAVCVPCCSDKRRGAGDFRVEQVISMELTPRVSSAQCPGPNPNFMRTSANIR